MAAGTLISAEQFLERPDRSDACGNLIHEELLGGEIKELAIASLAHDEVKNRIGFLLALHLREHADAPYLSYIELGLVLSEQDIVKADVCLIERSSRKSQTGRVYQGAPALAIEVLSPSDNYGDVSEKTQAYLKAGCAAVWLVNPFDRAIDAVRLSGTQRYQDFIEIPDLLPGFRISIPAVFDGI